MHSPVLVNAHRGKLLWFSPGWVPYPLSWVAQHAPARVYPGRPGGEDPFSVQKRAPESWKHSGAAPSVSGCELGDQCLRGKTAPQVPAPLPGTFSPCLSSSPTAAGGAGSLAGTSCRGFLGSMKTLCCSLVCYWKTPAQ